MIVDADEAAEAAVWRSTCSEAVRTEESPVPYSCCSVLGWGDRDWANPPDGYGNRLDLHASIISPCHDDQLAALLPPGYLFPGNPMADIRLHRRDLRPAFRLRTCLCGSLRARF